MPLFEAKEIWQKTLHDHGFLLKKPVELIAVDDHMRSMIHDGESEQSLEKHARKMTPSIRADGRRRVLDGTTTLEEVLRVTQES